jgi:hypothetical protein
MAAVSNSLSFMFILGRRIDSWKEGSRSFVRSFSVLLWRGGLGDQSLAPVANEKGRENVDL